MLMRCRCGGCLLLSSIPRKVSMVSQPRERYVPEFPGYCTTLFDSIHLQNLVSIYKHCLRLAGLVRIDKGSRPTELTGNGIPARYEDGNIGLGNIIPLDMVQMPIGGKIIVPARDAANGHCFWTRHARAPCDERRSCIIRMSISVAFPVTLPWSEVTMKAV